MADTEQHDAESNAVTMPLMAADGSPATTDTAASQQRGQMSLLRVGSFILITEFCERLAFYGIVANLVLFLQTNLNMAPTTADSWSFAFSGTCYVTPILGGWLADSYLGRFRAIFYFIIIYLIGMVLFSVASYPSLTSGGLVFAGLLGVAIGTGGIKPNVSAFGADQFSQSSSPVARQSFFNWFYWMVNLGALLAFTVLAYVEQNISYFIGYLVPTLAMATAIITFFSGRSRYLMLPPQGSVVSETVNVLAHATSRATCARRDSEDAPSCLDRASVRFGGSFLPDRIKEVKELSAVMPIMFTYILYWTVDQQVSNVYVSQGELLRLQSGSFVMPVAALGAFDAIVIIGLIPLMDKFVYPWLERRGIVLDMLKRVGVGYFMSILSLICAGVLEHIRLSFIANADDIMQNVGGTDMLAANISVFWQIPQYALIGASEVFAATTGLEFAYSQAPTRMRSVVMAIYLVTTALGDYLGSGLLAIIAALSSPQWLPDDLNMGRLDLYYYTLAGIMGVNLIVYIFVARAYVYKTDDPVHPEGHKSVAAESPRGPTHRSAYDRMTSK